MFEILRKSLKTGIVTSRYPATPAEVSDRARGRPEIDFANWRDARPAAAICPPGAVAVPDDRGTRTAVLDLGKCIFCGLCAEVDGAIRMSNRCELAARHGAELQTIARYALHPDGSHASLLAPGAAGMRPRDRESSPGTAARAVEDPGRQLNDRIGRMFGRSLH